MFQQDNVQPHTARVTMDFLTQNNIKVSGFELHRPSLKRTDIVLGAHGGNNRYWPNLSYVTVIYKSLFSIHTLVCAILAQ